MASNVWPYAASLTEENLPDQSHKVFIVTGANTGLGFELTQILYSKNAKIYVAARSAEKAEAAIASIQMRFPDSKGQLVFLELDLADLSGIKAAADFFLSRESRLDVLWNNAGVMVPPQGSKTKQGYELQLGTNNVAPFLFTKLLTPILIATAKNSPPSSVRVVWLASAAVHIFSPPGGVRMDNLDYKVDQRAWTKYGTSKAGNLFHSVEFAKRYGDTGVISVAMNPGNLKTDLFKNIPFWQRPFFYLIVRPPIYGAYTELYGGLSPDVTVAHNGAWIMPWGKIVPVARSDLRDACKRKSEGGTGIAEEFWDWTEKQVSEYL